MAIKEIVPTVGRPGKAQARQGAAKNTVPTLND